MDISIYILEILGILEILKILEIAEFYALEYAHVHAEYRSAV
jgi:hypothetical protein